MRRAIVRGVGNYSIAAGGVSGIPRISRRGGLAGEQGGIRRIALPGQIVFLVAIGECKIPVKR